MSARRLWSWVTAVLIVSAGAMAAFAYRSATASPLVRRLSVQIEDYPAATRPVRIVLFSDLHVHGPDMPPARVERIVAQINALHPDVVVAVGDFIGNHLIGRDYPVSEALAPLARLRASSGVFAVLGNND